MISRDEWLTRYDKPKTRSQAQISLNSFDRFLYNYSLDEKIIIEQLNNSNQDDRYLFLQKYVNYLLSKSVSPSSIKNYFTFVRNYLRFQGLKTDPDEIKNLVKFPKPLKEIREPMTKQILKQILNASNKNYRAFWLVLMSSGARMNEILSASKLDYNFNSDPVEIRISPINSKNAQGKILFISNQAKTAINEIKTGNLKLFNFTQDDAETYFNRIRKKCNLLEKYSNNKNYLVNIHSMRSFLFTQAALKHGEAYAHALEGRGAYLQTYLRLPRETKVKKYKALEPFITIPLN